MTQTASRKFSPIFTAEVTFGEVVTGTTRKGVAYARSRSTVEMKGGQVSRQVMAFGDQLSAVSDHFVEGTTAILAVQHDNGTLRVIGYPRTFPANSASDVPQNDNEPIQDAATA